MLTIFLHFGGISDVIRVDKCRKMLKNDGIQHIKYTAGLDPRYKHTKINFQKNVRATTIPKPPLESSQRGESENAVSTFV